MNGLAIITTADIANVANNIILRFVLLAVVGFVIAFFYLFLAEAVRVPSTKFDGDDDRRYIEEATAELISSREEKEKEKIPEWWTVKTIDGKKTGALGDPEIDGHFLTFRKVAKPDWRYDREEEIPMSITFSLDQVVMWYMDCDPAYAGEDEE